MDIKTMSFEELETRKAAIAVESEAEGADVDALLEEIRSINAAIEERKAREAKQVELRAAVAAGAGTVIVSAEAEERKAAMPENEIRNSQAYVDAFAKYIRTGNDEECRALLSDATASGTVPVPAFAEMAVANRIRESRILSRVRRSSAPGILKVGFEIAAPEAAYHAEGGAAIDEEALQLGIVTMNPGAFKKWVSFSDELLENSQAFVEYLYDEVARGLVKGIEKAVITAILNAPQTATATAPAVAKTGSAAGAITDFINARALLSGEAEDLVIIVSPTDYATYRGLQMAATYGVDPFDGREVIISEYATAPIIGDLYGVTVNRPNGDDVRFKLDETTLMTSDMVRLLGKQSGAVAVTSNLFFAKVSA